MAKLNAPLGSFSASGSLGPRLVYQTAKGKSLVRHQKAQKDRITPARIDQRSLFAVCVSRWKSLTNNEKLAYVIPAQKAQLTTYAYFVKSALTDPKSHLGLIAFYGFNQSGQPVVKDLSKNGNAVDLEPNYPTDAPTYVQSKDQKMGKALDFDGSNDYAIGTKNLGITGDAEFTMEALIKWTGSSWSNNFPSFMGNNSVGITNKGLSFTVQSGRPALDFWDYRIRTIDTLEVNTWYHLLATKTPGTKRETTKIYVNGLEVSTVLEGSNAAPNIIDQPPVIGRLDSNRGFNGLIDNVRYYNRALISAEAYRNSQITY